MIFLPVDILYKNLGMQVEVNEISKKETFWRKKYIAVWRWEFTHTLTKFDVSLQHPGFKAEPLGCSYDRMGKVSTVMKLTVSGGERPIEK